MPGILKKIFSVTRILFPFILLTLLTQTGGLVFLLARFTHFFLNKRISNRWILRLAKTGYFLVLYFTFTFFLIPFVAPLFGKVALPVFERNHVCPATLWTCLLNRHYVNKELRDIVFEAADGMQKEYPGTTFNYMDANFPLFNFPMLPHISHDNGRHLDIALLWKDKRSGISSNDCPSPIGYGVGEDPKPGEWNYAAECKKENNSYDFMSRLISQSYKDEFLFDEKRNHKMVEFFADHPRIRLVIMEPHLKFRLGFSKNEKVKFQPCRSVKHDDHIHLILKSDE